MTIEIPKFALCAATLLALSCFAHAQQTAYATLPDAPGFTVSSSAETSDSSSGDQSAQSAQPSGSQPNPPHAHEDNQPKRILGIIPNFRAVNANVHLPPQTVKEKFVTASEDSFDYSALVLPTALALENYETNSVPEFGTGGVAFGRYLWHDVVDQTSENYWVEFIVPAIAHEDTRYYTLGSGGFLKRTAYSLSRAAITRSDSGRRTFNSGEIIGAGAAAGVSNLYYPTPERTLGNTLDKWGTNVGVDAVTFFCKEFWPDINHKLFHGSAQ